MTEEDVAEGAVPEGESADDAVADEVAAELAAIAEAEADELPALRTELQEARDALEAERAARSATVARYRDALLAAEPALPPELIQGDDLETLDASVEAARRAVAQIRERLGEEATEASALGFPAGAPERRGPSTEGMSSTEKIAFGLERRARG